MNRIPIWFDTDLGVDDAVALLSIGKLPNLDLRGISAVAGNAELCHTFENARNVCHLAGIHVPVYPGAEHPLFVPLHTAPLVHGENGVGDAELSPSPAAEFNIYGDPHAAQMVFRSGVPVVMCGLDVTMKAYLTPAEVDEIGSHGTPVCRFFRDSNQLALKFFKRITAPGLCCHDTCPVLFLSCPELFSGEEAGVYVETRGTLTLGKTVTDLWSDKQFADRHVFVVLDVDRDRFAAKARELLLSY